MGFGTALKAIDGLYNSQQGLRETMLNGEYAYLRVAVTFSWPKLDAEFLLLRHTT